MTREELIQTLIANIDDCLSTNADVMKVDVEYLPIIKDALKKQLPKKARLELNKGKMWNTDTSHTSHEWKCPVCSAVVGEQVTVYGVSQNKGEKDFCEHCGQAIDWEDING